MLADDRVMMLPEDELRMKLFEVCFACALPPPPNVLLT